MQPFMSLEPWDRAEQRGWESANTIRRVGVEAWLLGRLTQFMSRAVCITLCIKLLILACVFACISIYLVMVSERRSQGEVAISVFGLHDDSNA
jgi:hypothetical protein